ncbi:MAG: helix-turn-helix domain-containing protein [Deferribacterales bacterium]
MELKERLSSFISELLREYKITQKELALILGVGVGSVSAYVKGKEVPRIDVLIKLAEFCEITIDELVKGSASPKKKEVELLPPSNISNNIAGVINTGNITSLHNGDVYNNTVVRRTVKYTYVEGDLTEKQGAELKKIVDTIVENEKLYKQKPASHAAVWKALNRKFKVTMYRKIPTERFDEAKLYLQQWNGRIKRNAPKNNDEYRKSRYRDIFAIAKNELGWSKHNVDDFIFDKFEKESIRDLTSKELETLYNTVHQLKRSK